MSDASNSPLIGLALGSGASRGWSHIAVIKALLSEGVEPDIVCGTSVGATVGGSYVAGKLDELESWVLDASRSDALRFFDIKFSQAGFVNVERLKQFLHAYVADAELCIDTLSKKFMAVCTDLDTGREVWCREGGLADAVRASMAMPGLFPPVQNERRWLVDGGLVNPVPVSACRALGADVVIAVNLNSDIVGKRLRKPDKTEAAEGQDHDVQQGILGSLKKQALEYSDSLFSRDDETVAPSLFYAISSSINIFQDRITRSRLAGDPADVLISPKLGGIGILEFQRAAEAMEEGEASVKRALPEIRRAVGAQS